MFDGDFMFTFLLLRSLIQVVEAYTPDDPANKPPEFLSSSSFAEFFTDAHAVAGPMPAVVLELQSAKVDELETDWSCPKCQWENWATRPQCFKCNVIKPAVVSSASELGGVTEPHVCKEVAPDVLEAPPVSATSADGNDISSPAVCASGNRLWNCSACRVDNVASRKQCWKCQACKPRPQAVVGASRARQEGDWICARCRYDNFGSRARCYQCKSPPPPRVVHNAKLLRVVWEHNCIPRQPLSWATWTAGCFVDPSSTPDHRPACSTWAKWCAFAVVTAMTGVMIRSCQANM